MTKNREHGFTFIETTISLVLVAMLAVLGFSYSVRLQNKQKMINAVTDIVSNLQNAQTQSIATKPNGNGEPAAWGVLLQAANNETSRIALVPIADPSVSINTLPSGSRLGPIPAGTQISSAPTTIGSAILISFDKRTGNLTTYQVSSGNLSNPSIVEQTITLTYRRWQQDIVVNPQGQITTSTIRSI